MQVTIWNPGFRGAPWLCSNLSTNLMWVRTRCDERPEFQSETFNLKSSMLAIRLLHFPFYKSKFHWCLSQMVNFSGCFCTKKDWELKSFVGSGWLLMLLKTFLLGDGWVILCEIHLIFMFVVKFPNKKLLVAPLVVKCVWFLCS